MGDIAKPSAERLLAVANELLEDLESDYGKALLRRNEYRGIKADVELKKQLIEQVGEDYKAGKMSEKDYGLWLKSFTQELTMIRSLRNKRVEKNTKRTKTRGKRFVKYCLLGVMVVGLVVGVVFWALKNQHEHRAVADIREPIQEDCEDEQCEEVHKLSRTNRRGLNYALEMKYLATYDIEGLIVTSKRYDTGHDLTPFDYAFPIDLGIAWGESAKLRDKIDFGPGYRSMRFELTEELISLNPKTVYLATSSNNHLSPADDEIYQKLLRIKVGDYVRLQGYLVDVEIFANNTQSHITSSLTRTDTVSYSFQTANTGCEVMLVTAVDWLD